MGGDAGSEKTVRVGPRLWRVDDVAVTVDREGRPLEHAATDEAWAAALQANRPAYRLAANPAMGLRYNRVAMDVVAADGWRVPTAADWEALDAAAAQAPSIVAAPGFDRRDRSGPEDGREASYWMSDGDFNESWGASMEALPVVRYSWITMWGAVCEYGLFLRLVRDA